MKLSLDSFTTNTKVLVVGAGRSGLAALRLAARCGCGLALSDGGQEDNLGAADRQWLVENKVSCEFGGHTPETFLQAEIIIVSPGVPLDLSQLIVAQEQGIAVIGELEFASLFTKLPIVAVTGTNGKTTVTTLIATLLQGAGKEVFVGGNIGTPLSEFILSREGADLLVLEVSSFQLDTAPTFHAQVALLLNISPDHLDRYSSFAAYADSKMGIFMNQDSADYAIINGDDQEIMARKGQIKGRVETFHSEQADRQSTELSVSLAGEVESYQLPPQLCQAPNRQNCHAAILAVRSCGCVSKDIQQGLAAFEPLAHRLTPVATIAGVNYVDDSKATNIGALHSALAGQEQKVILIAGGRDKGGDYGLLRPQVERIVKKIIVLGEAAELISQALADLVEIEQVTSMAAAVKNAAACGEAGETVLLSPACASFDMFRSYGHRGQVFQEAVHDLQQDGPALIAENDQCISEAA